MRTITRVQAERYSSTADAFTFCYYDMDHLGNIRQVTETDGSSSGYVIQRNDYYPFGMQFCDGTASNNVQSRKYNGKEFDNMHGLNTYDYGARQYNPITARWDRIDPLAEKYYGWNAYAYCMCNPVIYVDPDGNSTWVVNSGNNQYKIIGGDINDKDLNIYLYTKDPNGEYTFQKENWTRGEPIGQTPVITSFYNSDSKSWATGSIINTHDQSGINFLNKIKNQNISLIDYMWNARSGHKYDFKVTNGIEGNKEENIYRGMPIKMPNGKTLYTSARDIGNMAAGYKAGAAGIDWKHAEKAFDMYESYSSTNKQEGISTKNAEKFGYMLGRNSIPMQGRDAILNLARFISSIF